VKPDFAELVKGLDTLRCVQVQNHEGWPVAVICRREDASMDRYETEVLFLLQRWKKTDPDNIFDPMRSSSSLQGRIPIEKTLMEIQLLRQGGMETVLDARVVLERRPMDPGLLMFRCHAAESDPWAGQKETPLLLAIARRAWECGLSPDELPQWPGALTLFASGTDSFLLSYVSRDSFFLHNRDPKLFRTAISQVLDQHFQPDVPMPQSDQDLQPPDMAGSLAAILGAKAWRSSRELVMDSIVAWLEDHPAHLAAALPPVPWHWNSIGYRHTHGIVTDDPMKYLADAVWAAIPQIRSHAPGLEGIDGPGCMRDLEFISKTLATDGFLADRFEAMLNISSIQADYDNWLKETDLGCGLDDLLRRRRTRKAIEIRNVSPDGPEPIL
jgi:hypothetical protein